MASLVSSIGNLSITGNRPGTPPDRGITTGKSVPGRPKRKPKTGHGTGAQGRKLEYMSGTIAGPGGRRRRRRRTKRRKSGRKRKTKRKRRKSRKRRKTKRRRRRK